MERLPFFFSGVVASIKLRSTVSFCYRYLNAKERRYKREVNFQLKQIQLENEKRRLEKEHEMNVLRLILGQERPPVRPGQFVPNDNASC